MTAKRYTIKPQDDLFGVVDNYSADKVCVINGIRTELEAKWLCKDMNTLNDENEQLKKENYELHKRLGDFKPFEEHIKERTSKTSVNDIVGLVKTDESTDIVELKIETQYVSRKGGEGILTYEELTKEVIYSFHIIVNCTPLGTFPKTEFAPDIPYQYLTAKHLLYDLVYNPEKTLFLRQGEEKGCIIKNGLEMLHLQAIKAWEIWNEEK